MVRQAWALVLRNEHCSIPFTETLEDARQEMVL